MAEPKYFSPVFFSEFRTGVSLEKVRTCNFFFSFCPQIYTHIHEIGSEILDQKIRWFRDLRAHRTGMKELSLSQESSCMVAQQSKFGRRKSIVIVLSPVLGTFSTLSHSLSKELWGVIIRS